MPEIQRMSLPERVFRGGRHALYSDAQIDEIVAAVREDSFSGDPEPIVPEDGSVKSANRARNRAYQRGNNVKKKIAARYGLAVRVSAFPKEDGTGFVWAVGPVKEK